MLSGGGTDAENSISVQAENTADFTAEIRDSNDAVVDTLYFNADGKLTDECKKQQDKVGWSTSNDKFLTINAGYTVDFGTINVEYQILNDGGTIKNGVFPSMVKNYNGGTFTGTTFRITTNSFIYNGSTGSGTPTGATLENCRIEYGGWEPTVHNYGVMKNCTVGDRCTIWNYAQGEITGEDGDYQSQVTNRGTIKNGTFSAIKNDSADAVIEYSVCDKLNNATGTVKDGFYPGKVSNTGTITGGLFAADPSAAGQHVITATDCKITIVGESDKLISNKAYLVGDQQAVAIKTAPRKFNEWTAEGFAVEAAVKSEETDWKVLTIPAGTALDENVTVTAVYYPTKLQLDANKQPVDDDQQTPYYGREQDGWSYNNATLTLYAREAHDEYNTLNFPDEELSWQINNNGGLIQAGKYTGTVRSGSTNADQSEIAGGTFTGSVLNYGTVSGGTFADRFFTYGSGKVTGGVFSRFADFGEEEPSTVQLIVKGGKVNDEISGMAYVVGKQLNVKVETTKQTFTNWTVSGDTEFALTEEQAKSRVLNLELDGADGGTIILTANSTEEEPDEPEQPDQKPDEEPDQTISDGGSSDGDAAAVILGGAAVGAATYFVGTQIWMETHLPDGVIPTNREQLALMLWNAAGKPQPAETALYADISAEAADTQLAARWCVEQGLMKDYGESFQPGKYTFRPQVIKAWNQVQKMK